MDVGQPRHCIVIWVDPTPEPGQPWLEIEPCALADEIVRLALEEAADCYDSHAIEVDED